MIKGTKICFIIGNQRTGTNLLRDILVANDGMCIAGEIVTPSHYPECWYNFLMRRGIGPLGPKDWYEASDLMDQWIAEIQASMMGQWGNGSTKTKDSWVGGDIKYNQLRAISPVYWEIAEIPFILLYIMSKYGFVIHTRRRNVLKMVLSAMIAEQSGIWHLSSPGKFQSKYSINMEECLLRMRKARLEEEEYVRLSAGVQTIECFYEDMEHHLTSAVKDVTVHNPLDLIAMQLGIPGEFAARTSFKKVISQPYSEIIANYSQMMKKVSETEFAAMAEEL